MIEIKNILGTEEFEKTINSDKPVLVDFYATWCGPCKMQAPILKEFAEEVGDKVTVVKVDVDENASIASKYSIQSIPTLVVFKNGEIKEKAVGLTVKANLSQMLIKYL